MAYICMLFLMVLNKNNVRLSEVEETSTFIDAQEALRENSIVGKVLKMIKVKK